MRSVGKASQGRKVTYSYNQEKKFLGFISYEVSDKTYAFGAYDSICNHLNEAELPQESKFIIEKKLKAVDKAPKGKVWNEAENSEDPKKADPYEEAF